MTGGGGGCKGGSSPPPGLLFRELHNKVLRDLALLGYLGQLQAPAPKPLRPLHSLTPYQVHAELVWGPAACLANTVVSVCNALLSALALLS